ncbi:hypothetical protein MKW98_022467 [Papaver atlanticum]|uniref:DNA topoisomerase I n=1 Tax=Papaver atlanticum TaxID=357466 RepID=A0AAD4T7G9_9MAGN|nr:hypothetical protein MKW98_022467 [Papaver atlanticum]
MVAAKPKCPDEPRVCKTKKNKELKSVDKSKKLAQQSLEVKKIIKKKHLISKISENQDYDDAMDKINLSSLYNLGGGSSVKNLSSDSKKENQVNLQDGFVEKENKPSHKSALNKRNLANEIEVSVQSAVKKPKLMDECVSSKAEEVVEEEEEESEEHEEGCEGDEEDNIPLDKRRKKLLTTSSIDKSKSTVKQKSTTSASSFEKTNGKKWSTFAHKGGIFPPPYKPHGVATMFAVMKDTHYAMESEFIKNFMNDRKEKKILKEEKLKQEEKYMWAVVDGKKEQDGNFRIEPPGLFRGRGDHPKVGKLKKRIYPKDITINIGKGESIPECPIPGERWKEVKHDNSVAWLACWQDPINPKEVKYVSLGTCSSLKCQSDKEKYEKARLLKDYIVGIRENYRKDFTNKDLTKQQIAVAAYLIDMLALRAGNEKDADEADTVGCCTLKVENVTLVPQTNKIEIKFLGKDSIQYENTVEVEPLAYEAIKKFKKGKNDSEDLFDKLNTNKLNAHLKELMPGLTAEVFRTYNASITLDNMLNSATKGGNLGEKIGVYERANKQVAELCNHQRTESKTHPVQMLKLNEKIVALKNVLDGLEKDLGKVRKGKPQLIKDADGKPKKILTPEKKMDQTTKKIEKMEQTMKKKEELKNVALGTSKTNYLDPRISVAWCKRHEVPIEKIYQWTLLAKFAWAMDVDPGFRFNLLDFGNNRRVYILATFAYSLAFIN